MPEHDTPWTPGPWCFTNGQLLRVCKPTAAPVTICGVHRIGKFSGRDDSEAIANGRLIAAAPALYEALAAIVSPEAHVADDKLQRIASGRLGPTEGYGGLTNESASRILRARAALALARGETNG